jgi:putative membrane-bound dehydrogenase-like protein
MKPAIVLSGVLALAMFEAGAAQFQIGVHSLTVSNGFTVQKVAGPGLVDRPIVADFDEQGRLYVAESSGSNDPVNKQMVDKPHRIVRLEDSDGDGSFDKSIVFADKMMFPEGAMWHGGALYVSAPPVIWRLRDTDGDGVADQREQWLDAKTLTGCANDLHGPYLGLDGWIYWCKGAFAAQSYERPGAAAFQTRAAHIFRRRPEGGVVEAVMTGGMDNPVDVTFTPEGERIFTTTFFQHPGGGQRDGLAHAIYGGVYGKVHNVLDDHKKTGDLMPVLTHLGPAAPAGLTRYESEAFGKEYRDSLFAALFNLHKVTRHVLERSGASYKTVDSDFLVSDNTDFHPTDVIEDADGSLLVIDTGGWYKLCCPTSQLWKPDVLGAIYRVRRTGAPKLDDPRGAKIDWEKVSPAALATLLGDDRPVVAKRAVGQLRQAKESVGALRAVLQGKGSDREKINAVWALASNHDTNAPSALEVALDSSSAVRHAALHALAVTPEKANVALITRLLSENQPPQVRRAAAELLGRTKNPGAVAALLQAASRLEAKGTNGLPDRVQEHSIIYALIEIHAAPEVRAGLQSTHSLTRRSALIALDQMDSGALTAADVIPLLASNDSVLKQTANWIIAHRNDWGGELAQYFEERLKSTALSSTERDGLIEQIVRLGSNPTIQDLVQRTVSDESLPAETRASALKAMSRAGLKEMPSTWVNAIARVLATEPQLKPEAVAAAGAFQFKQVPGPLKEQLAKVAADHASDPESRLRALAAFAGNAELKPELFDFLRAQLGADIAAAPRRLAGAILAKASLTEDQLAALCVEIQRAGPMEIAPLLSAFEKGSSEKVGRALLAALKDATALSALNPDQIQRTVAKFPESIQVEAKEVYLALNTDAGMQSARLEELLPKLQGGDVRRGQAIFNSAKAACSSCHAIGYLGGDLGPDLTRIGQVRTERDLLEAILYPSASFVRSYEPVVVATRDGEEYSGVLRTDAPDEVVLATGPGAQVRLARNDITTSRPGKVSVMPQGLDQQLTTHELADLLSFLKATRW